jgi:ABC-type phosphate transport system auxiliary subunit
MYDLEDERGVPISSGIPRIVLWAGIAGVILIFIIAALVLAVSGYGHLWPSDRTLNLKL